MASADVVNGNSFSGDWENRYYHVDQILDRPGPRTVESFMAGEGVKDFLRNKCKILVIGAGGLGCEILANLALSGFKDIHVIDMDTIDISNLNRQFLFRQKDVGQPKAIVAAEYVMKRVRGVKVTPYYGKIQDKGDDYYMQFNLIICGLDSVEARRWINATLVNMVDPENPESLKPLIDGGTEGVISALVRTVRRSFPAQGFKGQARVILPTITSCYECSLDMLNKPTAFPICTIANTPRLPEHCIEFASVLEWPRVQGDRKMDTDDPEHISWLYSVALARAKEFKIEGVTWSLTQASCCNEAFKIATSSAAFLNNYFMLIGTEGVYSYTFEHEKRDDCPVCGGESLEISVSKDWTLDRLIEMLVEKQDIQIKKPSLSTPTKQLYFQAPPQLEEATRPNLEKKVTELVPDGGVVTITASTLPFNLSLRITHLFFFHTLAGQVMPKADINKAGWEQSEFPILCETCLGDNAFVRMSKQEYGRSCGTCARPFTVFRWNPGTGMRFKTTVICQTCARIKNVCQTCLLDLEYGLPTQVRDTALALQNEAPTSEINREYYAQNMDGKLEGNQSLLDAGRASSAGKEMLKQLARTDPYYKRNRPHVCSFFAKGECKRGNECPYRHEKPVENELSKQNIQDRYHGNNDPVARKIMSTHANNQGLAPPEDASVMSLFLSSLPTTATEATVRTRVLQSLPMIQPAQLRSVVHVGKSRCAFVNFKDRASAERAAEAWANGLDMDGERLAVRWGRSKAAKNGAPPAQPVVA
ncbi:hypothetical protein EW146_g7618 [Bondarzewia mesenterica]|uniref:Pre-mRNA-splicing factor SLT11 n=1 Tax=Bondarzewia mesenterica TaxID=1095465 RepID=A0A4S4LKB3_9AGAM|nr:hypothetical protein EW146_g7618 [Bondarzewia mesenterica]